MAAVHLVITGRVQGVWYRGWTVDQANARGLSGWVRNRRDGSVEAVISGGQAEVDDMIGACHDGPLLARVDKIDQSVYDGPELGPGFGQRATE